MVNRREVRWMLMCSVVVLVALWLQSADLPLERPDYARYPELDDVDPKLERSLREAWPRSELDSVREHRRRVLESAARAHGPASAKAIFRILVDHYEERGSSAFSFISHSYDDRDRNLPALLMGELADEELRGLLVRAFEDRDAPDEFRRKLVIALCQPAHPLEPLLRCVLDRQEDNEIRKYILFRLHRLKLPAPKRLRALLYQPFGQLAPVAAATLARMGDPEAPTLVSEGFEQVGHDRELLNHLVRAVEAFTGEAQPFRPDTVMFGRPTDEMLDRWYGMRVKKYNGVLLAWRKDRTLDTEFERVHRAYLASEQYRREESLQSFEDVLAADESMDLGSASLVVTGYSSVYLRRLHRFAHFLRGELEGVEDPATRIEVLNRWIFKRHVVRRGTAGRYPILLSFLPYVFSSDAGNCVGYSTLYLALAERLNLPLHSVLVPGHCFVRYDDGDFRRNIETTALGAAVPDAFFGAAPGGLRRRTKRELLATILSNQASAYIGFRQYEEAQAACEGALKLDPDCTAALANYANVLYQRGVEDPELLEEMLQRSEGNIDMLVFLATLHGRLGNLRKSVSIARRARELSDTGKTRAALALALAAAGKLEEARTVVGDGSSLPLVDLRLRVQAEPDRAEAILRSAKTEGESLLVTATALAEVLLSIEEPKRALAILDHADGIAAQSMKDSLIDGQVGILADPDSYIGKRRMYYVSRAAALLALDRTSEAHAALAAALERGAAGREILDLRRRLARD